MSFQASEAESHGILHDRLEYSGTEESSDNMLCSCALTGILFDFFCDLPEPFFKNMLSSKLTHEASFSMEPEILDQFLKRLSKNKFKTQKHLLHFRQSAIIAQKMRSVKLLSRLFDPLLLIPSLSPDTEPKTSRKST